MTILALDPSINHLGWALMTLGRVHMYETISAPTAFKQEELVYRIDWVIGQLDDLPHNNVRDFDIVAIECPEPWGAYKSMASSRSGSLQMLTLLVGALTQWALSIVGADNVKLVKVSQHKGQLPKHVTQRRMEKKYYCKFKTSHEADAVNLGDYVLNCTGRK